jgi:hypothetical protein
VRIEELACILLFLLSMYYKSMVMARSGEEGGGAASMKRIKINFEICCRKRRETKIKRLYIVQWSNWTPTQMFFVLGWDLIRSSNFSKLK